MCAVEQPDPSSPRGPSATVMTRGPSASPATPRQQGSQPETSRRACTSGAPCRKSPRMSWQPCITTTGLPRYRATARSPGPCCPPGWCVAFRRLGMLLPHCNRCSEQLFGPGLLATLSPYCSALPCLAGWPPSAVVSRTPAWWPRVAGMVALRWWRTLCGWLVVLPCGPCCVVLFTLYAGGLA